MEGNGRGEPIPPALAIPFKINIEDADTVVKGYFLPKLRAQYFNFSNVPSYVGILY